MRTYDHGGRIANGVLVTDGGQALAVIRELLARPDVPIMHLRNVGYGCDNFTVRSSHPAADPAEAHNDPSGTV